MLHDCVTVTVTGIMPLSYFYDLCNSHMWYYAILSSYVQNKKKLRRWKKIKEKRNKIKSIVHNSDI